jgi:hypothetical protein
MFENLDAAPKKAFTVAEYGAALAAQGSRTVPGFKDSLWIEYERYALERIPIFRLAPPVPGEIDRSLKQGRALIANYLLKPDICHPHNAWLYVCTDQTYSLEKLVPAMRRNVRRGLAQFTIDFLTPEQVLENGLTAFCDTRRRNGLTDGTQEEFHRRFNMRTKCQAHVFLGAWSNDTLAGFVSATEVDDWLTIEGCFSTDTQLNSRPNDVLMYKVLSRYLVEEGRRLVSYGISSLQPGNNGEGLHAFKTKVGFKAHPVHRAFALHPLLQPLANRFTLWGLHIALSLGRGNRRLNKLYGTVAMCLQNKAAQAHRITA